MIDVEKSNEWQLRAFVRSMDDFAAYWGDCYPIYTVDVISAAKRKLEGIEAERLEARRAKEERRRREHEEREKARAEARENWFNDPLNEATARGWEAMKRQVPGLDGVQDFRDLPDVLMYRYGEFARAVLKLSPSAQRVLSSKQSVGRTAIGEYDGPLEYVYGGDDE